MNQASYSMSSFKVWGLRVSGCGEDNVMGGFACCVGVP